MRRSTKQRWSILAAFGLSLGLLIIPPPGVEADAFEPADEAASEANAVNEAAGRIERAYRTILGRAPEPGGLRYWLDQAAAGMDYADIVAFFLTSPEREAKYPDGQSDEAFLDQLYQDAFGREPDAGGRAYWLGQLAAGRSRIEITLWFADSPEQRARTGASVDFELNILHINDHHSHLQPDSADLILGGESTRVELGGFPRVVAKFDELQAAYGETGNVAKLHAGDAITGTLFYSLFDGEADAAMMNHVCFDAFAVGNHEFDGGDEGLATFLDFLNGGDCQTPVLAANVVPQIGTPLAPVAQDDYLEPFTIKEYPDGRVGFIGIDIAGKTQNSSSPLDTTQFLDEVATAQSYVDQLADLGVDKVVLITHYQYDNDLDLASMVSGVDVIVGGDSHSLLGDFDPRGLTSAGPYPTLTTDATGLPVCVAQAWQYSAVVGELNVSFDQFGHVAECGGTPHMLLGSEFLRRPPEGGDREPVTGDALAAIMSDIDGDDQLSIVTPDAAAEATLSGFAGQVDVLAAESIGAATEDLCLERIPGQGRSSIDGCTALTAVNGGHIQQVVADAFRSRSFEADIALQNAGGVRIDIPAGDISVATAYELLPFANTLVNLEMTGQQIVDSIEEGVENAVRPDGSTGAYPYASGIRWDMDLTQPNGSRASNFEYRAKGSDTWVPFDLTATYTVVTNNFMASGGDGYDTMGEIYDSGAFVDTFLDYAKSFIDYVVEDREGSISRPATDEYSTQSFVPLPND